MIRELVLQMKLGHVRGDYFRDKFGVDIRERFRGPLDELLQQGHLVSDGRDVRLKRDGLLQVDKLLHGFFLPRHRDPSYV